MSTLPLRYKQLPPQGAEYSVKKILSTYELVQAFDPEFLISNTLDRMGLALQLRLLVELPMVDEEESLP